MLAILKRELYAYFISPIGYFFIAIFLLLNGGAFAMFTLQQGTSASTSTYFTSLFYIFIIIIPLLTMRLMSEDKRQHTDIILLTSPVSLVSMTIGKFLAAYIMFAGTLAVSSINLFLLYTYGTPNGAILLGNLIGILLLGAAFIALGLFISSMTENQAVSAIITFALIVGFVLLNIVTPLIGNTVIRVVLDWISVMARFNNFTYGLFDINSLIYYLSLTVVFLFLTVRIYEMKRWQ